MVRVTNTGNSIYQNWGVIEYDLPAGGSFVRSSYESKHLGIFSCSAPGATVSCSGMWDSLYVDPQETLVVHIVIRADSSTNCTSFNNAARIRYLAPSQSTVEATPVSTALSGCEKQVVVTPVADAHGRISPDTSQTLSPGQKIDFAALPDPGYDAAFSSSCGPDGIGNTYTTNPVWSDCTVTAHFSPIDNIVTPVAGVHTTISPNTPIKLSDYGKATFKLTAESGYTVFSSSDCHGSPQQRSADLSLAYVVSATNSDCIVQAIAKPNLVLSASPNPAVYGLKITLTATLTDSNPPGKVWMMDAKYGMPEAIIFQCGPVPVINHVATCVLDTEKITYSQGIQIIAAYDRAGVFQINPYDYDRTMDSANLSFLIPTSIELAELSPMKIGGSTTVVANLAASVPGGVEAKPTGTITIRDEINNVACSYLLSAGNSGCTFTPTASGSKLLTASYSGDTTFASSVSAPKPLIVAKSDSRLVISSSNNTARAGEPITFSAWLTGYSPQGTLAFEDNGLTICGSVPLESQSNGLTAGCTTSSLSAGEHTITARYQGDSNNSETSTSLTQEILSERTPSKMVLSSTWNPATQGHVVTLTTAVIGRNPAGSVDFFDASTRVAVCAGVRLVAQTEASKAYCRLPANSSATSRAFTAVYHGDGTNESSESDVFVLNYAPATEFNPNQAGLTGSWYNPATSGQGLLLQVFPDQLGDGKGQLFAGWFTYTDPAPGSAVWYTLQGEIDSNGLTSLGIYSGSGGVFDAASPVNLKRIGSASMKFADCSHATLEYTFSDDSNRGGAIPLQRLTANSACSDKTPAIPQGDALLSGTWYSKSTSGQGFLFDIAPAQNAIFAAWYTYSKLPATTHDPAGGRRWYTLQTNSYIPGSRAISNVSILAAQNGLFDDPAPIESFEIGKAEIRFDSCLSMSLSYRFTAGENNGLSGTIPMVPIGPVPAGCH